MRRNNKGFSLVEFIVTFAIVSIIGLAVYGFMSVSNRQFKSVSNDVGLQYDQQIIVNQIRDYILESSDAIFYDNDEQALFVFKQTDAKTEAIPEVPGEEGMPGTPEVPAVQFKYSVSKLRFANPNGTKEPSDEGYDPTLTGTIFVSNKLLDTFNESDDADTAYKNDMKDTDAEKILGSSIQSIKYDLSEVKNKKVSFDIVFYSEGKEFKSHQVVSLRNTIIESDQLGKIYETTSNVISSSIESVTITRNGEALNAYDVDPELLKIGKYGASEVSVQLDADVKISAASKYAYTKKVNWSIVNNPDPDNISITEAGVIKVKGDATPGSITVLAESKDDKAKTDVAIFDIVENGAYPDTATLTMAAPVKMNGYTEYTFIPKVKYTNSVETVNELVGEQLTGGTMKIEWHLDGKENLPGIKYGIESGIDNRTGKLCLTEDAIGKTFKIWFTVKELKYDGEVCKSEPPIVITPTEDDFLPYETPESIRINMPDTCNRNDSVVATVSWVKAPEGEIKYYWKVVSDLDNNTYPWYDVTVGAIATNFDKIVTVRDYDLSSYNYFKATDSLTGVYGDFTDGVDGTGWYVSSSSNRFATLDIASFLYWKRAYKIKVMAFAIGKAEDGRDVVYDASGVHYVVDNKPIVPVSATTVAPKVQFILEASDTYMGESGYKTDKIIKIDKDNPGEDRSFGYKVLGYSIDTHSGDENGLIADARSINTHYQFKNSAGKQVVINKNSVDSGYTLFGESRVNKEELSDDFAQFMFNVDIRKEVVDPTDKNPDESLRRLIKTDYHTYNPQKMIFHITLKEEVYIDGVKIPNSTESNEFTYNLSYKQK